MYDDNDLLVEVTSSSFKPTDKSQSGEFNGATGTVKVQQGTDGLNKWSFAVDASTFKPDEYIVRVAGVTTNVVETSLFNVVEAGAAPVAAATPVVAPTEAPVVEVTAEAPVVEDINATVASVVADAKEVVADAKEVVNATA